MRAAPYRRSGLTLLEVLISTLIFFTFLAGMTQLLNMAMFHALEVQNVNQASQLLQSQMNRVICGELSLSSQGESTIDDFPNWTWSMNCEAEGTPNLWHVTITVNHEATMAGQDTTWSLHQLVLDPAARGAIQASSSSSSSSSSNPTSPASPSGSSNSSNSSTSGGP
jgi:Tfp pilus assembly protein PilV